MITISDAVSTFGVSRHYIHRLISKNEIPINKTIKRGREIIKIDEGHLFSILRYYNIIRCLENKYICEIYDALPSSHVLIHKSKPYKEKQKLQDITTQHLLSLRKMSRT